MFVNQSMLFLSGELKNGRVQNFVEVVSIKQLQVSVIIIPNSGLVSFVFV